MELVPAGEVSNSVDVILGYCGLQRAGAAPALPFRSKRCQRDAPPAGNDLCGSDHVHGLLVIFGTSRGDIWVLVAYHLLARLHRPGSLGCRWQAPIPSRVTEPPQLAREYRCAERESVCGGLPKGRGNYTVPESNQGRLNGYSAAVIPAVPTSREVIQGAGTISRPSN
jgi:hypothetical protein